MGIPFGIQPTIQDTPRPSHIRLPSGNVHGIDKWRDILFRVVDWLWSSGRLTRSHLPISSSANRYVLSTTPVHPGGNPFRSSMTIPNGPISIEVHRSAASLRSAALKLLKELEVDASEVWVKVSDR